MIDLVYEDALCNSHRNVRRHRAITCCQVGMRGGTAEIARESSGASLFYSDPKILLLPDFRPLVSPFPPKKGFFTVGGLILSPPSEHFPRLFRKCVRVQIDQTHIDEK